MLSKVIELAARWTIGKKLLDLAAVANAKLLGHRTELVLGLEALLYGLKKLGLLPAAAVNQVDALATALLGALPVTLAEKISRAKEVADRVLPDQPVQ